MTVACRVCGKPVVLPEIGTFSDGPLEDSLRRIAFGIARSVVHETCKQAKIDEQVRMDEMELMARRAANVGILIPPEYQDTDESRPEMHSPWVKQALSWQYGPKGLLLTGPTRSCKSRAAYLILKREHLAGKVCAEMTHGQWTVTCLRLGRTGREFAAWNEGVASCDLFLLDDFGKAAIANANDEATRATELLFELIDSRWRNHLPMIITTNMRAADIASRWKEHGRALAQRLAEAFRVVSWWKAAE